MPSRVSPTEAVRPEIHELFGSGRDIAEVLEEVMRLSARPVLQQVLEDEVTTWLGRDWNSRSEANVRVSAMATAVSRSRPRPGRSS